jgi:hypothetical protein
MSTRRLFPFLGALFVVGAFLLSCGRSPLDDSIDSMDATGSAGAGGKAGATGGTGVSTADLSALCQRACTKIIACLPVAISEDACVMQCATGGMQSCANFAEVFSQTDKCVASATCVDLEACLQSVPTCQTSTGAVGAAGASGGACTSVCTRAVACCHALTPSSDCSVLQTACATSADKSVVAMTCQSILTAGASIPAGAAACR